LLHRLRNTIVYHYPENAQLTTAFEDVPDDEDWAWHPSATINNSFYLAPDLVITASILRLTGETDTEKAFKQVMDIVIPVSNDMTFLYLMRAIVERHVDAELLSPAVGTGAKIDNVPDLNKIAIP
jgi:hypothetical protein